MPANKKKKKAANPARGFATISTVSKSRFNEEVVEDAVDASVIISDIHQLHDGASLDKLVVTSQVEKELSELSPEHLERQLEESELQILVDQFGEKSKKDTLRHVSRIQTERRLLRSQANQLRSTSFLPAELLQWILIQVEVLAGTDSESVKVKNTSSKEGIQSDDLSIKLWTLARALRSLGFLQSGIRLAIHELLRKYWTDDSRDMESGLGKQTLWGFDRCLDSLALNCSLEELPDYESSQTHISRGSEISFDTLEEVTEIGESFFEVLCRSITKALLYRADHCQPTLNQYRQRLATKSP